MAESRFYGWGVRDGVANWTTADVVTDVKASAASSYKTDLRVGCMLCAKSFKVKCGLEARADLQDLAGSEVPVAVIGGSERSTCGVSAVNGQCQNAEAIAVVRELITDQQLNDVQITG